MGVACPQAPAHSACLHFYLHFALTHCRLHCLPACVPCLFRPAGCQFAAGQPSFRCESVVCDCPSGCPPMYLKTFKDVSGAVTLDCDATGTSCSLVVSFWGLGFVFSSRAGAAFWSLNGGWGVKRECVGGSDAGLSRDSLVVSAECLLEEWGGSSLTRPLPHSPLFLTPLSLSFSLTLLLPPHSCFYTDRLPQHEDPGQL